MANVILPINVDDLPVVEPNQPDVVPVIPDDPVIVDEDEDPEEEEFEEEDPQEEEEYMEMDVEEDENESEFRFPYEEVDPLNPPPPASDSEFDDVIEVEDTVEPEDETVPASVHEVGESSTATFLREDGDSLLPGLMRRDIDSLFGRLILDLGNEVHSSMEEGAAAMENLVRKLGNAEEKVECKKLKKELEESRLSNTLLRDLCLKKDRMKPLMFRLKKRRVYEIKWIEYLVQNLWSPDGISAKEETEWIRQTKGSGYDLRYQKAALSKEVNAESGEVCWWKRIRNDLRLLEREI
ncbi:hypothetical protein Tco_0885505 [Tanacetum coccineum]